MILPEDLLIRFFAILAIFCGYSIPRFTFAPSREIFLVRFFAFFVPFRGYLFSP
jgi:hypothetical protein